MNPEITALYQEIILDHNRHPRNFGEIEHPDFFSEGYNPLCGDQLKLYLNIRDDKIIEIKFTGKGCAISTASASLLTEYLLGKNMQEAEQLFQAMHLLLTDEHEQENSALGKLNVLAGVKAYPSRVKCASLAWHTLHAALKQQAIVSTE